MASVPTMTRKRLQPEQFQPGRRATAHDNVGTIERWLSVLGGGALPAKRTRSLVSA